MRKNTVYGLSVAALLLLSACKNGSSNDDEVSLGISGKPAASVNEEATYTFTPVVSGSGDGRVEFSISNKPEWAEFSAIDGTLTGTPDDPHVGTTENIVISASSDGQQASLTPFSIVVVAVNDAPIVEDVSLDIQYDKPHSARLAASDVDSAELEYALTEEPARGTVTLDPDTGEFVYTPAGTKLGLDSFSVSVNDGEHLATATVSLALGDASKPVVQSMLPGNNARNVALDPTVSIRFDDAMDFGALDFNKSAGACGGDIQLSADNFTSCLALQDPVLSEDSREVSFLPAAGLDSSSVYQLRVTTALKNIAGLPLELAASSEFTTQAGLLITEVGSNYWGDSQAWFEIYNNTSQALNLADYKLRSDAQNRSVWALVENVEFALPDHVIHPGTFMIVSAQDNWYPRVDNELRVYLQEGSLHPYWSDTGFIELIKLENGKTEDFVVFGGSLEIPVTADAWEGETAPAMPSAPDEYGHAIVRSADHIDTNSKSDWKLMAFSTPGLVNDLDCDDDTDLDGIPDCAETEGGSYAGMPLYDWGARVGTRDIFIEVDYMDSDDEGVIPREEALQKVVDAFAAQGIALHFDVGDLFDGAEGLNPAKMDLGGGEIVPFAPGITIREWGPASANLFDYKEHHFDNSRRQIFNYMLFAYTQQDDGSAGSSGYAEINGNDSVITLGAWDLNSADETNLNLLINYQAGTVMHEFGHNLGLYHGGFENAHFKPNYLSVMNYLYQLEGLPTIGTNEGDRYLNRWCSPQSMVNAATGDYHNFVIDFSSGSSAALDENSLMEADGLGRLGSGSVDWNCNGSIDSLPVTADANRNGRPLDILEDYDDWANIEIFFARFWNGANEGVRKSSETTYDNPFQQDPVRDDRQPVSEEMAPSAEFFEALKKITSAPQ